MREIVMHDLEINNNEVSDLKALFSVLKTRKTKIFVYGFMLAFMACTAFLAFNPSGNASPWINNLFTSSSSSTFPYRSQFSSSFSYIFPNSSRSSVTVDVEQKNGILVKDQTVLGGLKVENQTRSGLPVKNLGKESVGNKKDGNLDGRNRSGSGVPVKCTFGCNITVSMKKGNGKKEARVGSTESVLLGGDMAVNFTVSMKKGNGNIVNQKEVWIKSLIDCDVFQGRWVKDESYPLYTEGSCPHIDEPFNCFLNGRLDKAYQNLRWQPNGCNIPRLNASDMLERLRGKRLVFVGDSLNRNMWESLVCVLRNSVKDKRKVFEMSGRREFRTEGSYSFLFRDYGCTIEFFRSPFLVQEWEMPDNSGHKKETLRLDTIESSSSKYKDAHVIIFNTGHWWTHEKTSKGKDYYQEGNHVYGELNVVEAFHRALNTWATWVDANVNPNKTLVFFRGYSASHFRGGQWNSGGACDEETEPIKNETYLSSYPSKMSVLETVLNGMRTPVSYLNITRMTDYRKDAHPSVYRKQNLTEEEKRSPEKYQECIHWCLPGVPDSWNELLYSQLLIKQYQQH